MARATAQTPLRRKAPHPRGPPPPRPRNPKQQPRPSSTRPITPPAAEDGSSRVSRTPVTTSSGPEKEEIGAKRPPCCRRPDGAVPKERSRQQISWREPAHALHISAHGTFVMPIPACHRHSNWSHKPHTPEMYRVRPALEAGLMQAAKAAALYRRPGLKAPCQKQYSCKNPTPLLLSSFHHLPKVTNNDRSGLPSK